MSLPLCHLCRKDFVGLDELSAHYYESHGAVHLCRLCSRQFMSAVDLKKDHTGHISGSSKMNCRFCMFMTNSVKKMDEHYLTSIHRDDVARMTCTDCSGLATSESNLAVHRRFCIANKDRQQAGNRKKPASHDRRPSSLSTSKTREHTGFQPADGEITQASGFKILRCPCSQIVPYYTALTLYEHCIARHRYDFAFCMFCCKVELGLGTMGQLREWTAEHRGLHERNALASVCLYCSKDFGYESVLRIMRHMNSYHGSKKKCICHMCQEYLPAEKFLLIHRCPGQRVNLSSITSLPSSRSPNNCHVPRQSSRSPNRYTSSSHSRHRDGDDSHRSRSPRRTISSRHRNSRERPSETCTRVRESGHDSRRTPDPTTIPTPGSASGGGNGASLISIVRDAEQESRDAPAGNLNLPEASTAQIVLKEEHIKQEVHIVEDSPSPVPPPDLAVPYESNGMRENFQVQPVSKRVGLLSTPVMSWDTGPTLSHRRQLNNPLSESSEFVAGYVQHIASQSRVDSSHVPAVSTIPEPEVTFSHNQIGYSVVNGENFQSNRLQQPLHVSPSKNIGQVGSIRLAPHPPVDLGGLHDGHGRDITDIPSLVVSEKYDHAPTFASGRNEPPQLLPVSNAAIGDAVVAQSGVDVDNFGFEIPSVMRGGGSRRLTLPSAGVPSTSSLDSDTTSVQFVGRMPPALPLASVLPTLAEDYTTGPLTVTFHVCALCRFESTYKQSAKRHVIEKHRVAVELWKQSVRTVERTLSEDEGATRGAIEVVAQRRKKAQRRKGCQTDDFECPNCVEKTTEIVRLKKVMKRMKKMVKRCFPDDVD